MRAEYGNPHGTDIWLIRDDGSRMAVKPDHPELAGLEIARCPVDPRTAVAAAFAARVDAGLPVAGHAGAVQLDPDSRRELMAAAQMAMLEAWPAGGFWRLSDNTNLPLSAAQVVALGKAAGRRYQALFAARSALLDAVAADEAIEPEAGWPDATPFDPAA